MAHSAKKYPKSKGTTTPQKGHQRQTPAAAKPKPGVGKRKGPNHNKGASKRADQALG